MSDQPSASLAQDPAPAPAQDQELVLPPLQDAILPPQKLVELLGDIEQVAQLLEVRIKSRAQGHSAASEVGLGDVAPALAAGCAVQLRYRHGDSAWLDTLMPHPQGVRLVRIQS